MLVEIKNRVKAKNILTFGIINYLDAIIAQKPCAFVRMAYNLAMFVTDSHNETFICGEEAWDCFV